MLYEPKIYKVESVPAIESCILNMWHAVLRGSTVCSMGLRLYHAEVTVLFMAQTKNKFELSCSFYDLILSIYVLLVSSPILVRSLVTWP